jgi:hypothetical protein
MTDAIRLNGKKRWNGETVEFTIAEVSFVNQKCGDWWIEQGGGAYVIDPATIRLADDPRNAMLTMLRSKLLMVSKLYGNDEIIVKWSDIDMVIDEMEAKL